MKPSLEIAPPITQLDSHFLFAIGEFHQSRSDVGGIKISIDPHLVASRPNGQLTRRLHVKGVCVCVAEGGGEGVLQPLSECICLWEAQQSIYNSIT